MSRHRAAGISPPIAHQNTGIVPSHGDRVCECFCEPGGVNTWYNARSVGQHVSQYLGSQDIGEAEVIIQDIRIQDIRQRAVLFRRRDPAMDEQLSRQAGSDARGGGDP
jgi:hypothetical protein